MCRLQGAGRGVGKEHALLFAREGAKVVVNDLDKAETDGVVAEIKAMGGEAAANYDDCSTWEGGKGLIKQCIEAFGGIDTLVNNAVSRPATTTTATSAATRAPCFAATAALRRSTSSVFI